jgi:hypothetical protein
MKCNEWVNTVSNFGIVSGEEYEKMMVGKRAESSNELNMSSQVISSHSLKGYFPQ